MEVLIMGCGRTGGIIANSLAEEGHTVTVLDADEENLKRLPDSPEITAIVGDGTLEEDLRQAGVENADVFVAVEESDTRNALAAQKARYLFNTPKVVCHMVDPLRHEMYSNLGLLAISPTRIVSEMILEAIHG
jgi:trk system potassium uptake protein TrkA